MKKALMVIAAFLVMTGMVYGQNPISGGGGSSGTAIALSGTGCTVDGNWATVSGSGATITCTSSITPTAFDASSITPTGTGFKIPVSATNVNTAGNMSVDTDTNELTFYGDARRQVVSLDQTQTLTNKTATALLQTIPAVDGHTGGTNLSAANVSGTVVSNYGQTDDAVLNLPAAAAGYNSLFVCGTTVAKYWRITAAANDKIYFAGTAGSDNGYVGIASAAAGAYLTCFTFQTGASAYDWICITGAGTWAAGGP